jgi:hypothetical protein
VHALSLVVVVFGPLAAWRNRTARLVHFGMLWFMLAVDLTGYYCPLTLVETTLRVHYDPTQAYARGFAAHWADKIMGIDAGPAQLTGVMAGWTLLWTAVYAVLWGKEKRTA